MWKYESSKLNSDNLTLINKTYIYYNLTRGKGAQSSSPLKLTFYMEFANCALYGAKMRVRRTRFHILKPLAFKLIPWESFENSGGSPQI